MMHRIVTNSNKESQESVTQECKEDVVTSSDEFSQSVLVLNPVTVSYVNRPLEGHYGIPFHGYIVVSGKPPTVNISSINLAQRKITLKNQHAVTFYIGGSRDHMPFHVSESLLKEMEKSSFPEVIQKIVKEMKGKYFLTTEIFLRKLISEMIEDQKIELSDTARQNLDLLAMNPYMYGIYSQELNLDPKKNDFKKLLRLNRNLHDPGTAILPYSTRCQASLADTEAFEKNACHKLAYPLVNPTHIYELFQQQQLFQRYIESRLNIGESVDREEKSVSTLGPDLKRVEKRLVHFYSHTVLDNPFFANCNKATATFLEEAEYLSAKEKNRLPQPVVGATSFSLGSNQRMFFWNSRLHRIIVDLFINMKIQPGDARVRLQLEMLKNNPVLFQELVDKKYYILRIIETWPIDQEKRALEQILDPSTPLGTIFVNSRSGVYRNPDPSRGALSLAQERLKILIQEINSCQNNQTTSSALGKR